MYIVLLSKFAPCMAACEVIEVVFFATSISKSFFADSLIKMEGWKVGMAARNGEVEDSSSFQTIPPLVSQNNRKVPALTVTGSASR